MKNYSDIENHLIYLSDLEIVKHNPMITRNDDVTVYRHRITTKTYLSYVYNPADGEVWWVIKTENDESCRIYPPLADDGNSISKHAIKYRPFQKDGKPKN